MNPRIRAAWLLPAALAAGIALAQEDAGELRIERLTWAGIKMTAGETTVLIDAIGTDIWDGKAPDGLVAVEADTRRRYALVTHAHNDHFDVETLKRVLGDTGYVIAHESIATYIASRGLQVVPAATWVPVSRGGFTFTAVPASDGFGAEQVSWVVVHGERRYLHGGDTIWHGRWHEIGQQLGPFDAAFLPINGARLQSDPMIETPGTLTPQQAVDAALLLRARSLVPIHYGNDDPPYYVEVPRPLETLRATADRRAVPVTYLLPGEFMTIR
ncbi:MAG: MBL fold metallo-hydrolase [Gammaproteobacteria bacterium]|nr:MBL fold metallo-hydrolase [Gammaproteobacteria bacterium]MDH5274173.1 MBL fold metallo-hydrolase [Gammaproteobacteria bacterium]